MLYLRSITSHIAATFLFLQVLLPTCFAANKDHDLIIFDVNFVLLSRNPAVNSTVTKEAALNEIDILNTYFKAKNRSSIIQFRLKNYSTYNDIKSSECDFIKIGDYTGRYYSQQWQALFNKCKDLRVVDPTAINFYINDSFSEKKGFKDKTSHGINNKNRPYIILDWERLNHRIQSPEEHEMGHAFGLGHECAPEATINTSTNIMASADCGKGSGGKRNIGFNDNQVKTILENGRKIQKNLSMN